MRVLFIHEVNYLTKPIFEMHELPEGLASRGHEVGFVHFPEGTERTSPRLPFRQRIKGRVEPESQIELFTPWTPNGSISGRLITALSFGVQFRRILKQFRPDVVYSYSVPTSGWQALAVCRKKGIPYLFRALDVSTQIRKSIFTPLVSIAERYIYRNADWLSANNQAMLDYAISRSKRDKPSSVNLPPLDVEMFQGVGKSPNDLRESLGIPADASVIMFMGSFFYFSGLPELIQSFASQSAQTDYLLVIGSGEQEAELREKVNGLGISDRVLFTGFVNFDDLPDYFSIADVAVNPFIPSQVSNTALPNKVLQYMAAKLPLVSTRLTGLEKTFGDKSPGLVFVDSPEDVMPSARRLLEDKEYLHSLGEANYQLVNRLFAKDHAIDEVETLISNLQVLKS